MVVVVVLVLERMHAGTYGGSDGGDVGSMEMERKMRRKNRKMLLRVISVICYLLFLPPY